MLTYLLIAAIGLAGGFIGPITGGGGLITVPVLILLGFPAETAIASSRLGALGLWLAAIYRYQKEKKIDWPLALALLVLAALGGALGSQLLIFAQDYDLEPLVAILLLCMLPVVFFKDRLKEIHPEKLEKRRTLGFILFGMVMVFSGFFSGGDGTLGIFVLVLCFGKSVVEANAVRGPAWLLMGTVACLNYLRAGIIEFEVAGILFLSMAVGGSLGASTAIKKGERWVRTLLGLVVVLLSLRLLYLL